MGTCGVGGWTGPLPGDPDNNLILSAVPVFGGIEVSYTYPAVNPHAVAYAKLFRGTTNVFEEALHSVILHGNTYYDKLDSGTRYWYWVQVYSVNGTAGAVLGPATATARPVITDLIAQLTGAIDAGLLATSLRTDIDRITLNYDELTGLIAGLGNDDTALGTAVAALQAGVTQALGVVLEETTLRQLNDSVIIEQVDAIAALNQDTAALVTVNNQARVDGDAANASRIEEVFVAAGDALAAAVSNLSQAIVDSAGVTAQQITTVQSAFEDSIASVQTGLSTTIGLVNDKVDAIGGLYTVKINVNGLAGGFAVYNDGTEVQAGFDVDQFWIGRTGSDLKKPFIIEGDEVFINQAAINSLVITKLRDESGNVVVQDGGLVIRDSLGEIIFSAGVPLDWSRIAGAAKPQDGATRNVFRGEWTTDTAYSVGDITIEAGYGWAAKTNHISSALKKPPVYPTTSNSDWTLYTVKGDQGPAGANGTRTAVLDMYKNSVAAPTSFPSGNSVYTWSTGQFTAPATANGWSLTPPAPVAGQDLYVVRQLYSDNAVAATSTVAWTANTSRISAASGEPGQDGVNGYRTAFLEMYKWQVGTPTTFPAGNSTYTWATGAFTTPATANGWSTVPGGQIPGQTLWGCSVRLTNNNTSPTDSIAWDTSAAYALGIAGVDGAAGANGISVILSNEAHAFSALVDGTVTSYLHSGTQIRVYEGANELIYDAVGTANGTWKVTPAGTGVTPGAVTDSGSYATAAVVSGVAAGTDAAVIVFTVSGKTASGVAFTAVKSQTFTKAKAGAVGATGSQGIQGPTGPTGATLYTWLKYADTPTTGMSDDPAGKAYVGLAYNKTTAVESSVYEDYSWSLVKGTDGVQGPAGANGVTTYTWVKYADNAAGAGMSDSPTGKTYIGLAYNKTTAVESTVAGDYSWSLIKGADAARVTVRGANTNATDTYGAYYRGFFVNGVDIDSSWARGHNMIVLNTDGTVHTAKATFDTYGNLSATFTAFIAAIDAVPNGKIVLIGSFDATALPANLRTALQKIGCASPATWGQQRMSHVIVGQKGAPIGSAYEANSLATNADGLLEKSSYFTASGLVLNGASGAAVLITSNRAAVFTATDGVLDGISDLVLTATVSGVVSPVYAWTFSGLASLPAVTNTNSVTITAANMGASKSAIATCTVNGVYFDTVTIARLEKSTAAAGADVTSQNQSSGVVIADTRNDNHAPSWYGVGTREEFKTRSVIGAPGTASYGVLRTQKPWVDASGGVVTQNFKSADGEFKRISNADYSGWLPWSRILDRKISLANIDLYMEEAAIGSAYIGEIYADKIYSANWSALKLGDDLTGLPQDNANYSTVSSGTGGTADLMLGVDLGDYQIKPLRDGFGTVVASYEDDAYSTVRIESTASEYDHISMGAGSAFGTSGTAFVDVPGMVLQLPENLVGAAATVVIEGYLIVDSAATSNGFGMNIVSQGAVNGVFTLRHSDNGTWRYLLGGVSGNIGATTNNLVEFKAVAAIGAHTNFTLQIRSELSGSAVTLKEGSFMSVRALRNVIPAVVTAIVSPAMITTVNKTVTAPNESVASVTASHEVVLLSDGTWYQDKHPVSGTKLAQGAWLNNTVIGAGAGYEVRFTKVSGTGGTFTAPSGWVSLASQRTMKISLRSTQDMTRTYVLRVELRKVGDTAAAQTKEITANFTLDA